MFSSSEMQKLTKITQLLFYQHSDNPAWDCHKCESEKKTKANKSNKEWWCDDSATIL